ncbi:MAG: FHA domain-containing protein [Anaerolineae bacterium]|nr:FHA domain-containing protein [Anaerolineae bacterium]MDW8173291.1 FHA domain-containing protein [Anaerolineae bacterium]
MSWKLRVTLMSGIKDGQQIELTLGEDGHLTEQSWSLSIGRAEDNDIWLSQDTFASRYHAALHWREDRWWLEDKKSTNGSFVENPQDILEELRVEDTTALDLTQWIRIGRTWLQLQME